MIPISTIKSKIPEEALSLFQNTFTPSQYNKILLAIRAKRYSTFRINRIKSDNEISREILNGLKKSGFKIMPVSFIKDAYQFEGNINKLLKSDYVNEGKIYLQSIASLIPPLILQPEENQKILDIAAAPGSKTTQISALMNNTGSIDAVEPDYIRMERLKYNTDILGATNIKLINGHGENIYFDKKNYYDKTLADVPCSGEGRFNIFDRKTYSDWRKRDINKYSNLQKKLLKSAIFSTKINGIIVYSTCTMNIFENENVIDNILNEEGFKVEILPVEKKFKEITESIPPILKWKELSFDPSISNALRIIPSERIEGFFICKIKRIQ